MKVLWYVNIIMPAAGQRLGLKTWFGGGWLVGRLDALAGCDVQLSVLNVSNQVKEKKSAVVDDIKYIVIPPSSNLQSTYSDILGEEQPDVVHIYGTENVYNTDLIHVCAQAGVKSVVSLQGVMAEYAIHYDDGLPEKFSRVNPVIKLMRKLYYADSIALEKQAFEKQGYKETEALKVCTNVIGRTAWDRSCAMAANNELKYYHVNENLRDEFYTGETWSYDKCEKHSIFISQAAYPIKGLHQFLPAMAELVKKYPDMKVYIGGREPYTLNNKMLDIVVDYFFEYQSYIKKLIKRYELEKNIVYTGNLDGKMMKERYMKSNVFLSPSTIENSSNSIGEAMILGVPVVASNVGGTSTILTDRVDGLLYDFYDTESIVNCIDTIFDDREKAEFFSRNAVEHASRTHDRADNTQALFATYKDIMGII